MPLDKQSLYGQFLASAARREKLADLATRKALDLPADDDMHITTTHHSGLELKHLVGLAALLIGSGVLAGGGTLGLAGLFGWLKSNPPAAKSQQDPLAAQQYRVSFWTDEGQEIEVQKDGAVTHKPEAPAQDR